MIFSLGGYQAWHATMWKLGQRIGLSEGTGLGSDQSWRSQAGRVIWRGSCCRNQALGYEAWDFRFERRVNLDYQALSVQVGGSRFGDQA